LEIFSRKLKHKSILNDPLYSVAAKKMGVNNPYLVCAAKLNATSLLKKLA